MTVATTHLQDVPPVLAALRQATQASHKSVERLTPFFRPDFDRSSYIRWLDLMHGFYQRIDGVVQSSDFSSVTGWQYQARCELLVRDLAMLADRAPRPLTEPSDVLARVQALAGVGEIAGMLYVVEGSALGGQVLLKVLARSAGVTATQGASFFVPHGNPPQPRWAEYVQLLARWSATPGFELGAVRGAVTTFTALQDLIGQAWRG